MTFPESPKLACPLPTRTTPLHLQNPEERFKRMEGLGSHDLYLIDLPVILRLIRPKNRCGLPNCTGRVPGGRLWIIARSDKKVARSRKPIFKGQVIVVPPVLDQGEKSAQPVFGRPLHQARSKKQSDSLGYPSSSRGVVVHGG